mmetsp:Transcript_50703/g.105936  ORF Transcript_50703/g.105936 Transcript_50703/m.105936 type:complete len:279 (-) Transcript_50703:104-940(-)
MVFAAAGNSIFKKGSALTITVSLLYWAYIGLHSLFIGFPIACVIRIVHFFHDRDRRMLQHKWTTWWAWHYHSLNPFHTTTVTGYENRPNRPCVYVCNHQSTADISLMYGLKTHFKWVSKSSNFYIPLIGWNMAFNDYVPIKRGDKESAARMFAECQRHLAAGSSIVFFPEGTRSPDGEIKDFKHGAFTLAIAANVPVVPVVQDGSSAALSAGRGSLVDVYNGGGWNISLKILPAIMPESFGTASPEALAASVRAVMVAELARIRADVAARLKADTKSD